MQKFEIWRILLAVSEKNFLLALPLLFNNPAMELLCHVYYFDIRLFKIVKRHSP